MEIIAGDIGATKSALAWASGTDHASCEVLYERVYASADFADATVLLQQFMRDAQSQARPTSLTPACLTLALPGVVYARKAKLTNLDWTLDAADLQAQLKIETVQFINDFQAAASGVATLTAADTVPLNAASPAAHGVRAVTGAGTGLGLAWMLDIQGRYRTFATEGGHSDFAPANVQQARLLAFVRDRLTQQGLPGHVSWERLVSGLGLDAIYRFCVHEAGGTIPNGMTDGAKLEAQAAGGDPIAQATLELFTDLYGAWVGNVALLYRPDGGLYIAGGVSVHMRARVQSRRFMAACTDKGRMRGVVERTPISLIVNQRLGVQGAIVHAFDTAIALSNNVRSGR